MKRIALFTAFGPEGGGGATILRSIVPHLEGAEIRWFYMSNRAADLLGTTFLGPQILGRSLAEDVFNSTRLFLLRRHEELRGHAETIMRWSPDIAWVNAMNEGLLMGSMLSRLGVPTLHVSVHDDPAGLARKSRRYRHLTCLTDGCARALLKAAHSVDVVSEPMRRYYKERFNVDAGVVYRYIPQRSQMEREQQNRETIFVGHVGSAYSKPEVVAFLQALRSVEKEEGVRFKVLSFGVGPAMKAAATEVPGFVEEAGDVPEPEVVKRLGQCRFVYSMYSFDRRHKIFRETSLPTKLSTYLMAAKPILAHAPEGSSLFEFMRRFDLGRCVTSLRHGALVDAIRGMMTFDLKTAEVKAAVEDYCGEKNLEYLRTCFGLNSAYSRSA